MAKLKGKSPSLKPIQPSSLVVDRPNKVGWLIYPDGDCVDVILPQPTDNIYKDSKLHGYNYTTMKFSGKLIAQLEGQVVPVTVENVPFEHFKIVTKFGELYAKANLEAVKKQVEDSKSGDIPGIYVVNAKGKIEKDPTQKDQIDERKPGQTKKQKREELAKKAEAGAIPLKEEVEILKEVGAAEEVSVFDGYDKITIGQAKADFEAIMDKDHTKDYHSGPYFIGMWLKPEQKYVIVSTPAEQFEKQYPILFAKESTALWLYSALLAHPKAKDSISLTAPYPIHNIDDSSNDVQCIFVRDAKAFLSMLPYGSE